MMVLYCAHTYAVLAGVFFVQAMIVFVSWYSSESLLNPTATINTVDKAKE